MARAHQAAAEGVLQLPGARKRRLLVKVENAESLDLRGERFERSDSHYMVTNREPSCTMRVCDGHIMQRQASGGHPGKRPQHGGQAQPDNARRRCKADGEAKKNHVPAERGKRTAHETARGRKKRFVAASRGECQAESSRVVQGKQYEGESDCPGSVQ